MQLFYADPEKTEQAIREYLGSMDSGEKAELEELGRGWIQMLLHDIGLWAQRGASQEKCVALLTGLIQHDRELLTKLCAMGWYSALDGDSPAVQDLTACK